LAETKAAACPLLRVGQYGPYCSYKGPAWRYRPRRVDASSCRDPKGCKVLNYLKFARSRIERPAARRGPRKQSRLRVENGRHLRTIYSVDQALTLKAEIQDLHVSAYLGEEDLISVLDRVYGPPWFGLSAEELQTALQQHIVSVPPWVHEHLESRVWLQRWGARVHDLVLRLVHIRKLTRKFWNEYTVKTFRCLINQGLNLADVAAYYYRCFQHKITTRWCAVLAVRMGLIQVKRPWARELRIPPPSF
jgi:hypothetical protein